MGKKITVGQPNHRKVVNVVEQDGQRVILERNEKFVETAPWWILPFPFSIRKMMGKRNHTVEVPQERRNRR